MVETAEKRAPYQRIVARTAEQHRLLSVHWELTSRCNLRCVHCYVVKPGETGFVAPAAELDTGEVVAILDQLAAENVLNIAFSGGEVFTRPDFLEIARRARVRRFAIRILTNGTLITPQVADQVAALYPVSVEVSIHGARANVHDGITQVPGSFDRATFALRLLAERGVRTVVKTPLIRENFGELDDIRALAKELGAAFRHGAIITPRDDGCLSPLVHRLSDEELLGVFRREMAADWEPRSADDGRFCLCGLNLACIDPYGQVYPCVQLRIPAGSLCQRPLWEIWRESLVLQGVRKLGLAGCLPACSTCEIERFCTRCHGLALMEDGDLLGCSSAARREACLRKQVLEERKTLNGEHGRQRRETRV